MPEKLPIHTAHRCLRMLSVLFSLMSLPFAFSQSGWLVGALCMVGVGIFSLSTMRAMIDAVHLTRSRLRRRRRARIAHSASRKSLARMADGEPHGHESHTWLEPPMSSYGSTGSMLPPSSSPGPDALDPLDLSVIKQDPDADVIGYQQIAYTCFGESGRIFTDFMLIFTQMGSCSAFLILVAGNLQEVLMACGVHVRMEFIALALLPIIIALAIPRSTTFLAPAAHFGNFTLLTALATIIYFGMTAKTSRVGKAFHGEGVDSLWDVLSHLPAYSGSLRGVSVFFGVSAFSFAAHCEVVAVEADASSRQAYRGVLATTMSVITGLYIFIGVFGCACFADKTKPNILLNLAAGSVFINIVRVCVSCTLLVNIAMALLPASQTFDLIIIGPDPLSADLPHQVEPTDDRFPPPSATVNGERTALLGNSRSAPSSVQTLLNGSATSAGWPAPVVRLGSELSDEESKLAAHAAYHRKGNYIRIVEVVSFVVFAILVQNLSIVFSLVGSISGGITCFTLPPLFAWRMAKLERQHLTHAELAAIAIQVFFGLVLICLGLDVIISGTA
jgi:amino acid permease